MGRLTAAALLILALFSTPGRAEDGQTVYNKICYYCHDDSLVGSPMIGDADEWDKRRKKGIEELYWNALYGSGHMMERLDRQGYDEAAIKRAVDYLLAQSR